jgi:N-acylneuraminate cytidylyltransferase
VFLHALEWLRREENYSPRLVVHLRATSPLRPPELVDQAVSALAARPEADSLRAVCPPSQNPYKMWRTSGEYLAPLLSDAGSEAYNKPRQVLPETLWQTGHIDVIRRETLEGKQSMTGDRILPLLVDPRYAVDIDTAAQWAIAEWLVDFSGLELPRPHLFRHPKDGSVTERPERPPTPASRRASRGMPIRRSRSVH